MFHKWLSFFACQCLCLAYALISCFAPKPVGLLQSSHEVAEGDVADSCEGLSYCVCPRETICADTVPRMIFLGLAQGSAYFDYPLYVLLFLSKANHLRTFLAHSALSMYIPFTDFHKMHTIAGTIVGFEVFWHSFWHLLRWSLRGDDIRFLWETSTGRTGLVSLLLTPLVVLPMLNKRLKKRMSYELRKRLHYLSVVWAWSLLFHAPATHIMKIIGSAILVYGIDFSFGVFWKTTFIDTTYFRRLESCCELSFENPESFKPKGPSYVQLCVPWISKNEWHAFSLFPNPQKPGWSSICIASAGDWTKALHAEIVKPTCRPAWIAGPYASPFSTALNVDNVIVVASGVGITPALSLLNPNASTRRVNLVWLCNDSSLLEFYLKVLKFPENAWVIIYYTGRRELIIGDLPRNILMFKGMPNLPTVIPYIVQELQDDLGDFTEGCIQNQSPEEMSQIAIKRMLHSYSLLEIFNAALDYSDKPPDEVATATRPCSPQVESQFFPQAISVVPNVVDEDVSPSKDTSSTRRPSTVSGRSSSNGSTLSEEQATRGLHKKYISRVGLKAAIMALCGEHCPPEDFIDDLLTTAEAADWLQYDDLILCFDIIQEDKVDTEPSSPTSPRERHTMKLEQSLRTLRRPSLMSVSSLDDLVGRKSKRFSLFQRDSDPAVSSANTKFLDNIFDRIDVDRGGTLTLDEIHAYLMTQGVEAWMIDRFVQKMKGNGDSEISREGFKKTFTSFASVLMAERIKNWRLLYCGSSQSIVNILTKIAKEMGLQFGVEKFDW